MIKSQYQHFIDFVMKQYPETVEVYHQYFMDFVKKKYPEAVEAYWFPGLELQFYPNGAAKDADVWGEKLYSCHRDSTGRLIIETDF